MLLIDPIAVAVFVLLSRSGRRVGLRLLGVAATLLGVMASLDEAALAFSGSRAASGLVATDALDAATTAKLQQVWGS